MSADSENARDEQMPGILIGMVALMKRDLALAIKRPGDVLNPLFFFAMVATLFPLAVGPGEQQLQFSGPGVLWVAALLATLLSLNSLFLSDYEDGSLEQLLVSPIPLSAMALSKSLSHWLTSGLPLVIVSPLIAITYQMSLAVTGVLMATLLLGTISLSLLGSIGAALTVGLHRGTALLSLLILPLAMPVLIFGARTVSLVASGDGVAGGLYFLAAYALLMISISPFATAAALRISNE
jgi:heme exporter protein B